MPGKAAAFDACPKSDFWNFSLTDPLRRKPYCSVAKMIGLLRFVNAAG